MLTALPPQFEEFTELSGRRCRWSASSFRDGNERMNEQNTHALCSMLTRTHMLSPETGSKVRQRYSC